MHRPLRFGGAAGTLASRPDLAGVAGRMLGLPTNPQGGDAQPAPMIAANMIAPTQIAPTQIVPDKIAALTAAAMTIRAMQILGMTLAITIFAMITIFSLRAMMRGIMALTIALEGRPPPGVRLPMPPEKLAPLAVRLAPPAVNSPIPNSPLPAINRKARALASC